MVCGNNQATLVFSCLHAGYLHERFALQVIVVGHDVVAHLHKGGILVVHIRDVSHAQCQSSFHNGLTINADTVMDNGCPEHLVLLCKLVESVTHPLLVNHSVEFEDANHAVGKRFGIGEGFKQHSLLHWQQRVDTLDFLTTARKIPHHILELFVRPLCLAEVGCSNLLFCHSSKELND